MTTARAVKEGETIFRMVSPQARGRTCTDWQPTGVSAEKVIPTWPYVQHSELSVTYNLSSGELFDER